MELSDEFVMSDLLNTPVLLLDMVQGENSFVNNLFWKIHGHPLITFVATPNLGKK